MQRAHYLGAPAFQNLECACAMLVRCFGPCVYLVGSCLEKRDYRDVDVRCILSDAEFDRMFPNALGDKQHVDAAWCLLCAAIAEWLQARTKLPIDFQFQRMTQANAKFPGTRNSLGTFL
jgi:hypothetical protein